MALQYRFTVVIPVCGEGDIAIIRLIKHARGLQAGNSLRNRRLRNAKLCGNIYRTHRLRIGTTQHNDGLKIILVRHGDFFHTIPPQQKLTLMVNEMIRSLLNRTIPQSV